MADPMNPMMVDNSQAPQAPPPTTSPSGQPTVPNVNDQGTQVPPVAGNAGAAAPADSTPPGAKAMRPTAGSGVHGILAGMVMGALTTAAKVAKGVGHEWQAFSNRSPEGQARQMGAIERQQKTQQIQLDKNKDQRAAVEATDKHTEDVVRTNGISLDNAHKVLENERDTALYPNAVEADRLNLMNMLRTQNAADRDLASTLEAIGVHVDQHTHETLTDQQAKDIATGQGTLLSNGKTGKEAGYGFVSNDELKNTPLPSDTKVLSDWTQGKDGQLTPVYKTLAAGTSTAWDALITHDAGMKKFNDLQGMAVKNAETAGKEADVQKTKGEAENQRAEAAEHYAAAALNKAYAGQIGGSTGNAAPPPQQLAAAVAALPPAAQQSLQKYSPEVQSLLIRAAHGYISTSATFPSRLTKGGIGITAPEAKGVMLEINPNYSDSLFDNVKSVQKDFLTGKEGQAIRSFNQFLVHGAELADVSANFQRTNSPWMNQPLNDVKSKGLGQPGVSEMLTAVEAARQEWQSFIDSGYKPDSDQSARAAILMSDKSSLAQIAGVLGVMGTQAVGRLDQLNETYRTATGEDFPNLITPSGLAAAQKIGIGPQVQKYQSGGTIGQNPPPAQLQQLHTNPQTKQTIGWDGTQWVDSTTRKPVQ